MLALLVTVSLMLLNTAFLKTESEPGSSSSFAHEKYSCILTLFLINYFFFHFDRERTLRPFPLSCIFISPAFASFLLFDILILIFSIALFPLFSNTIVFPNIKNKDVSYSSFKLASAQSDTALMHKSLAGCRGFFPSCVPAQ